MAKNLSQEQKKQFKKWNGTRCPVCGESNIKMSTQSNDTLTIVQWYWCLNGECAARWSVELKLTNVHLLEED